MFSDFIGNRNEMLIEFLPVLLYTVVVVSTVVQ
jgi:hypothetical protein